MLLMQAFTPDHRRSQGTALRPITQNSQGSGYDRRYSAARPDGPFLLIGWATRPGMSVGDRPALRRRGRRRARPRTTCAVADVSECIIAKRTGAGIFGIHRRRTRRCCGQARRIAEVLGRRARIANEGRDVSGHGVRQRGVREEHTKIILRVWRPVFQPRQSWRCRKCGAGQGHWWPHRILNR